MIDDQIDVAVVVEVSIGDASADVVGIEVGAGIARGELEFRTALVPVQERRLHIGVEIAVHLLQVVVDVAVGDEAIRPAVVVEIAECASPADPGDAVVINPGFPGLILEQSRPDAHEKTGAFGPEVR